MADHTTDAAFDELGTSGWFLVMAAPKMLLCLVGFLSLAVLGWRRALWPRSASVALGLGAVLSLFPPHPPGVPIACLGFLIVTLGKPLP